MQKSVVLLLILSLTASSVLAIEVVHAQTVPKPSVPEFSVKQVDRSYDVPLTYTTTTDPFTGKRITTSSGGSHVTNMTIDVTIRNQQFSPVDLRNGSVVQLYYSVRTKGHFVDWDPPVADQGYSFTRVLSSNSDFTVVTLILNQGYGNGWYVYAPVGGQEDFQVQAEAGYLYPHYQGLVLTNFDFASFGRSGWSNTQTIAILETASTPNPSKTIMPLPTSSPTQKPPTSSSPTSASSPTLTPTLSSTPNPTTSTPSPFITSTPTHVIVQSVPTWFYSLIGGLVAVIAVLLGVIASMLRKRK